MVYKVLRRIQQPQPGTPGQTPSLFDKCTGFFYKRYTKHGTNGFTSHPKDEAHWLSVLLKDTSVTAWDSKPQFTPNWSSKLRDNNGRNNIFVTPSCVLSDA